jgi:hypothetical protein
VQDIYIDKLVKKYEINTNLKASSISLSFEFDDTKSFERVVDSSQMHEYRTKMKSVCYSIIISRFDVAKTASKLTKYLINSESTHLTTVNHLIKYLYETKHLEIKNDASKDEELTANQANQNTSSKQLQTQHLRMRKNVNQSKNTRLSYLMFLLTERQRNKRRCQRQSLRRNF